MCLKKISDFSNSQQPGSSKAYLSDLFVKQDFHYGDDQMDAERASENNALDHY